MNEVEVNKKLDKRLAQVTESKERAIQLRNLLAGHASSDGVITNRHPGNDEWHIEMTQEVALRLAILLDRSEG